MRTPTASVSIGSRLAAVAVFLGLAATGCQPEAFDVTIDLPEQRQVGQANGTLSTLLPAPFVFTVNLSDEAKIRNANPPRQVFIKDFSLVITGTSRGIGDIDTFDYLNTAEFFIEPTRMGSVLQRVKVADIPAKEGPAGLIAPRLVSNLNILPLLQEGAQLVTTATGKTPTDDVSFNGTIVLAVDVF